MQLDILELSKQQGQAFQRVLALLSFMPSFEEKNKIISVALDRVVMYSWHPGRYKRGMTRQTNGATPMLIYMEGYELPDKTLWYVPSSDWHELLAARALGKREIVDIYLQGIVQVMPQEHYFSLNPGGLWRKDWDFTRERIVPGMEDAYYRQVVPLTELSPAEILCLRALGVVGEYTEEMLKDV